MENRHREARSGRESRKDAAARLHNGRWLSHHREGSTLFESARARRRLSALQGRLTSIRDAQEHAGEEKAQRNLCAIVARLFPGGNQRFFAVSRCHLKAVSITKSRRGRKVHVH